MKKNNIIVLVSLLTFAFFMSSCSRDYHLDEYVELRNILINANDLLEHHSPTNNFSKNGKIESTTVFFKKHKSIKYINANKKRIDEIYNVLKLHISAGDEYKNDSIYILVFTNDFLHFITGEKEEDTCDYLTRIKNDLLPGPSARTQDVFFAPLLTSADTLSNWEKLSKDQKNADIKNYFLMIYNNSCRGE